MARDYKAEYARRNAAAKERNFASYHEERKYRKKADADLLSAGVYEAKDRNKKAFVGVRNAAASARRDYDKEGKLSAKTHDRLRQSTDAKGYHSYLRQLYKKKGSKE